MAISHLLGALDLAMSSEGLHKTNWEIDRLDFDMENLDWLVRAKTRRQELTLAQIAEIEKMDIGDRALGEVKGALLSKASNSKEYRAAKNMLAYLKWDTQGRKTRLFLEHRNLQQQVYHVHGGRNRSWDIRIAEQHQLNRQLDQRLWNERRLRQELELMLRNQGRDWTQERQHMCLYMQRYLTVAPDRQHGSQCLHQSSSSSSSSTTHPPPPRRSPGESAPSRPR